jgi:hypothetical protein
MSVKIKLKHSSVANKAPQPSDLDNGELALNTNAASPAAYIKDSAGNIVKLAGAGAIGGTPATETAAGIVELATAAETDAGTDNTRAVHPAGLKAALDAHLTPGTSTPPAAPTVGATYINTAVTPAVLNVWSGTAWVPQVGTATTAGTAPAAPATGQVWVDTSGASPVNKVWDGTTWVVMTVDTGTQAKLDAQVASVWTRIGTTLSPATTGDLVTPAVLPAATTSVQGAVQLADAGAVAVGTPGRVVDAAQLKAAVAAENIWDRSSVTGVGGLTVTTGSSAITAVGAALQNVAVTSSSGGGTGLRVNLTVTGGVVTAASVAAAGSGYAVNDTVTIAKAGVAGAAADIVLTVGALATAVVSPATAGDQVHTATGKLTVGGTAAAPNIEIKADGGIVANTDGLVYDAATKRLAIGTTSPSTALHVVKDENNSSSYYLDANATALVSNNNASGIPSLKLSGSSATTAAIVWGGTGSESLILSNRQNERARIDSSGRLLVGTSSARGYASYGTAGIQNEATSYEKASLGLTNNENSAEGVALMLGKTRGASIGSNTVVSSGDVLGKVIFLGADGSALRASAEITAFVDGTPGANDMPGRLVFSTTPDGAAAPVERMRISQSGTIKTYVQTSSATTTECLACTSDWGVSGRTQFRVLSNGNVENINNAYGAISDIKLKENIVDASSQWDDLKALQVRKYNFKEGQTHTQIGLIAQEVELVSPGLVSESPDRDEEGNDLGTVTKSVNYSVLYMKAVKALQEAMERIETLEAKVAALESA